MDFQAIIFLDFSEFPHEGMDFNGATESAALSAGLAFLREIYSDKLSIPEDNSTAVILLAKSLNFSAALINNGRLVSVYGNELEHAQFKSLDDRGIDTHVVYDQIRPDRDSKVYDRTRRRNQDTGTELDAVTGRPVSDRKLWRATKR